ncbi:MAG: citryl-CoA lyase [Patescibacteria group bacterium]
MQFKTSITKIQNGREIIRDHKLDDLVKEKSFVEAIFLLFKGELPNKNQNRMLNAIFTAVIDHGPATASALNARISASAKNPTHASLAAGLLGLGERHGAAVSLAMDFFYKNLKEPEIGEKIKKLKDQKIRISGFGHKVFTDVDPRTATLFEIAKETGVFGQYCKFALETQDALNKISSPRQLPLNIDGAVAAVLCDMGFDAKLGDAIFIIGRVPGLLAQIIEEVENDEGIRRLGEEEVEYIGEIHL